MAKPCSPAAFAAGLTTAGAGLYFVIVGVRLVAAPGAPAALGLLVVCAGLAFGLSGIRIAAQGRGDEIDEDAAVADAADEPETTDALTIQSIAPAVIVFCLAALATWIALAGDGQARPAFALGALVAWIYFIVLAHRSLAMLRRPAAPAVLPQPLARPVVPPQPPAPDTLARSRAALWPKTFAARMRRPNGASHWRRPDPALQSRATAE